MMESKPSVTYILTLHNGAYVECNDANVKETVLTHGSHVKDIFSVKSRLIAAIEENVDLISV